MAIARGQITITEQYDGYTIILSKESIVIPCTSQGIPLAGELGASGRSVVTVRVLKGGVPLTAVAYNGTVKEGQFRCPVNTTSGCAVTRVNHSTVAIHTVSADSGKFVFDIYLEGSGNMIQREVGFSKSKQGETGEMLAGKMLYNDPEFKKGLNGVVKYTRTDYSSNISLERVESPSDCPTTSSRCIKITATGTNNDIGFGGFYQTIRSRANAVFIQKVVAKLPVGYKLMVTSNSLGTGYRREWLTPADGTGKYEVYMVRFTCGRSGTFSTGGFFYVTGAPVPTEESPLEWYVAYATSFDLSAGEYEELSAIAKTIVGYKNQISETYKTVAALYGEVYGNALLSGTPKSDLLAKKEAFELAHTVLQDTILSVTSDGITTVAEKSTVDGKYTLFSDRVAAFNRALEVAKQAISDRQAQEKVDGVDTGSRNLITDRHNIITSGSDNPSATTYSSVLNSKGEREVTVTKASVEVSASRYTFIQSKLSEQVYNGQYVFSFDYKTNHAGGYVGLDWRNTNHTDKLSFYKTLDNTNGEWKRGWFLCDWTNGTTQINNLFLVNPALTALTNYISYRNIKLVRGNKGWDDSPAPEDVQNEVKKAQETADTAKENAKTANDKLTTWASDSYISPAEKTALKQQRGDIQAEYTEIGLQATRYGLKSDATWTAYHSAYTAANTALGKYVAVSPESIAVGSDYGSIAAYYPKRQAMLEKIAVKAKEYADRVAQEAVGNLRIGTRNLLLNSGRLVQNGSYNTAIYTTTVDIVAGKKYTFVLRGTTTGGQKFGVYMNGGNGSMGTFKVNQTDEVLFFTFTAIAPTANYVRKLHVYNIPSSGCAANPATIKWAALYEGEVKPPMDWQAAPEDLEADIEEVSKALSSLDTTVNGAFKDGIIETSEAKAIASNIGILNAEKAGIDASYTKLYANTYLEGTAKTNLSTAKTGYNTAHASLISAINTAIADGKASTAEKTNVDGKFTGYNTALGTYRTRVEEADRAIQDKIKALSIKDVTKDSKYYVGYLYTSSTHGVCLFSTKIPEKKNVMLRVDFDGYMYGSNTPFGVSLVLYTYSSGLTNYSYIVTGVNVVDRVRLGVKNGNVAIELKLTKDVYYPCFNVTVSGVRATLPVAYSEGWTFTSQALASGDLIDSTYTNVVVVGRANTLADELANAAQKAADMAQAGATAANNLLADIASDNKLTASEKQDTKKEWDVIVGEKATVVAQATTYGVGTSAYTGAYDALNTYITPLLSSLTTTSAITGTTFRAKFKAYYDAKIALLKAVTDAAKAKVEEVEGNLDGLQVGGENLLLNGDLRYYTNGYAPGWDAALNGDLKSTRGWSAGYNSGVTNPTTGYHAHLDVSKFGFPVLAYCNTNNRWLGITQGLGAGTKKGLQPGQKYTVSFDMYSEVLQGQVHGGINFTPTGETKTTWGATYFRVCANEVNKWKRYSATFTLDSNVDLAKGMTLYLYGQDGVLGNKWVKNISLQLGTKGSFKRAPEDVEFDLQSSIHDTETWVDTAKNKIASQLGFANYNSFVASTALGKTLIAGGKVNTELIEATAVVAKGIMAEQVNALSLDIKKGKLGGWSVDANNFYSSNGLAYGAGRVNISLANITKVGDSALATNAGYIQGLNISGFKSPYGFRLGVGQICDTSWYNTSPKANCYGIEFLTGNSSSGSWVTKRIFRLSANSVTGESDCSIAGWKIDADQLYSSNKTCWLNPNRLVIYKDVQTTASVNAARVMMYYNSATDYGLYGHNGSAVVFQVGGTNKIAGWSLDASKLYSGNLQLVAGGSVSNTAGKWSLNNDGSGKLAGGNIVWDAAGNVTLGSSVKLQWQNDIESAKSANHGYRYSKTITINGEHDKYYPVVIKSGDQTVKRDILVKRSYSELHPAEWNTATHGGNLTLLLKTNFGGWGGAKYSWEIHALEEMYNETFSGAVNCMSNMAFAIFLRGGGTTGAIYHIYSNQPIDTPVYGVAGCQICYNSDSLGKTGEYSWNAPAPRTRSSADIEEIKVRSIVVNAKNSYTTLRDHPLTKIDANGIYTGTLTAGQVNAVAIDAGSIKAGTLSADRIGAGTISGDKLAANSVTAEKISVTELSALGATIGGFSISTTEMLAGAHNSTSKNAVYMSSVNTGSGYFYANQKLQGFALTWYKTSNAGHVVLGQVAATGSTLKTGFMGVQMMTWNGVEYFCLSANTTKTGGVEVYNRIAGWSFDNNAIYSGTKAGVNAYSSSGITLHSGGGISAEKFLLKTDGSAIFRGTLSAPTGTIGGFTIDGSTLYTGDKFGTGKYTGMCIQNLSTDRKFSVYKGNGNEVKMYQDAGGYGVMALQEGKTIFQLGAVNKIGGWNFDGESLYSGDGTGKPIIDSGTGLSNTGLVLGNNGTISTKHFAIKSDGTGIIGGYKIKSNVVDQTHGTTEEGLFFQDNKGYVRISTYEGGRIGVYSSQGAKPSVVLGYDAGSGWPNIDNKILYIEGGNLAIQAGNAYIAGSLQVTQGIQVDKLNCKGPLISGIQVHYMTGTNPNITLSGGANFVDLYGTGNRKKVNISAGLPIGTWYIIMSEASQGYDVLTSGSERFIRNGSTFQAAQSSGQDSVFVAKVSTYRWIAAQMPVNWLGTWGS